MFRRRVDVGSAELELTKISFDILAALLRDRGGVVEMRDLIRDVWGYDQTGRLGFAYTAVYRLRKELTRAGAEDVIESIRGVGFRISAPTGGEDATTRFSLDPEARTTLDACSMAILIQDCDRRIIWANPAAARLTGYSVEELLAFPSGESLSPVEHRLLRYQFWQDVLQGNERRHPKVALKRRDGEIVLVNGVWTPVGDEAGRFSHAILELWDPITEPDRLPAWADSARSPTNSAVDQSVASARPR